MALEMRKLEWFEPGRPISSSLVHEAEKKLGVSFPSDYVELVTRHDEASNPDESEFDYVTAKGRKRVGNLGGLLSLQTNAQASLYETVRNLGERLPAGVIPFASTGHGDYICFDYRSGGGHPGMVYFSHEDAGKDAVVPLANDLSSFFDLLRKPADG